MRVMVMVKATKNSEAGIMPGQQLLDDMGKFNEELVKAGIMQAGDGLKPSKHGKRIKFSGGKLSVIDGPFAETKEQLLGFYVVDCDDLDEALGFARDLAKANPGGAYEIRPVRLFLPGSMTAESPRK